MKALGRTVLASCCVLALGLLTACDSGSPGQPTSPPGSDPSTQTPVQPPGSDGENIGKGPAVASPLDTERFEQAPCELLTDDQRSEFGGGEPGMPDTTGGGQQRCKWIFGANGQIDIAVWYEPGPTKSGLSDVYVQNDQGNWDAWKPTQIEGYPAVYVSDDADAADGTCVLKVGVRDDLYMNVNVIATKQVGDKSCQAAENAAVSMVQTMKGTS